MKERKTVCITIPVYKEIPDPSEIASLIQLLKVLNHYPVTLVVPQLLNISYYQNIFTDRNVVFYFERFEGRFFDSIDGYNQLMLSKEFYQRFSHFEYILIYQLDAWIFRDELNYWCNQRYDYIGAPWTDESFVRRYWSSNSRIGYWLNKAGIMPNFVGNGGLSLRKISSFLRILILFREKARIWASNEDIFWSLYVPYYFPFFRIPPKEIANRFAFETNGAEFMNVQGKELPMGCHAWEKYGFNPADFS